ncbi:MAG TPA: hypothetical protein VHP37_13015 [Burkholderiales bacterium]|nr:hypothetical protein [Burkholderiales bacterium]
MQISRSADALTLSYPLWIGALFGLLAVFAVGYAVLERRRLRRNWPLIAAGAMASWACVYFATFDATITRDAGSVYGFLRYDQSVRWKDAADIYLERRGSDWTIVVRDRNARAYDFNVGDLSIEDRDRVMAYMVDRMPADAFRRDATVLRREGDGPRPASFFSDQI